MTNLVNKNGIIGVLDIGTSKTCCLLARIEGHDAQIIGAGSHVCKGLQGGRIADLAETVASIGAAVDAAEKQAGEVIDSVVVNAPLREFSSDLTSSCVELFDEEVSDADISRLRAKAESAIHTGDKEILHCFPVAYLLDDNRILNDPRGLFGQKLGVVIHTMLCDKDPLRNLSKAADMSHLKCSAAVASPYAAGLACLTEEERRQGVAVVDLGAGSTGVAVFKEGQLIYAAKLPLNAAHITHDIEFCFSTSFAEAERLKILKGAAFAPQSYGAEEISVASVGEDFKSVHTRKELAEIIIPRVEETFKAVRNALKEKKLDGVCRNYVLTGGGSQLQSVREFASEYLKRNVRIGTPVVPFDKKHLIADASLPFYMGCFGLLSYALNRQIDVPHQKEMPQHQSKIFRFFRMLLDNC